MRFDTPAHIEQIVWNSRIADQPRAQNRTVINRLFNGEPPMDQSKAEENRVEVNRNFLEGTRLMTDARSQWNANFLKTGDFFTVRLDSGPVNKKREWGHIITRNINRRIRRNQRMLNQIRATGASTLLHGIGPTMWPDRWSVIPDPIPISSLLIASETDIDFSNMEWFAVFREMTPAQLYLKTHGPKVDPGWNMDLVDAEWKWVRDQDTKEPNATAFQYMPERIEELSKQDLGFWGSDAVPTIDVWDVFFREGKDGDGWYRRMILDWGVGHDQMSSYGKQAPKSRNEGQFLYTSGKRKYANAWAEIIHCQFGDCSCVAPFKYHSIRSLGWMLWGICDIQNRLRCKLTEQAFADLMWWFRTASNNDFTRLKKAQFLHMGVIPQGIDWVKPNERYSPKADFIGLVLEGNRQLMAENAASYIRDIGEQSSKEMTATEVMARTNAVNTLVSGVMNLAYTYEAFKYREMSRRFCIINSKDKDAREFHKDCLKEGVPAEYLDVDRWDVEPERALGAGNKTVEMAIVQYLNMVRKNLGPDGQRKVDHIGIEVMTEQADLAEELAPVAGQQKISKSMHDAELATDRLMRGLPFSPQPEMVYEDYVQVWLRDMTLIIGQMQQTGNVGTPQEIMGLQNMAQHIGGFLQIMSQDDESKEKVRQYGDILGNLMNLVKAFAQRQAEQSQQGGNGQAGIDPETVAKLQGKMVVDQAKAANLRESHAQKTAQRQVSFEMGEQQKEQKANSDLRRQAQQNALELRKEVQKQALDAQAMVLEQAKNAAESAEKPTTEE